jgi:hypothetical protein
VSGDRLLATARDPQRLNDLVERHGKQVSIPVKTGRFSAWHYQFRIKLARDS